MSEDKRQEKPKLTKKWARAQIELMRAELLNLSVAIERTNGSINTMTAILEKTDIPDE